MLNVTFSRYNNSDRGKCGKVMEEHHDKSTKTRQVTPVEERGVSVDAEPPFATVFGQGNCEWAYLCFHLHREI